MGKIKMKNIIREIKNILLEQSIETPASNEIDEYTRFVEKNTNDVGLHANNTKKKTKKKGSEVEEEDDIVSKSKEDLKDTSKDEDKEQETDDQKVETGDESPSTINLSDAQNFEKLIDVLNQFRAAHSFTDEAVSSRLKDYFSSLTREEKEVLHVLVKGLVQITVLDVDGKDAYTPSKLMFNINKTGTASSERKKSMKRKIDNKDSEENNSLPIVTIGNVDQKVQEESYKSKKDLINIVKSNNA